MAADIVFKFCVSDSYQDVSNCLYPHHVEVRSADDFIEMAKHDHVCASYKNNYRSKENFLESNVHGFDLDNDHTEDPQEWLTDKHLEKMFDGTSMMITESRNHMKWKGKYSPRPRYHIFFMQEVGMTRYGDVAPGWKRDRRNVMLRLYLKRTYRQQS